MGTEPQKTKKTKPVRIWGDVKDDLESFVIDRSAKERKAVTETEETSKALISYMKKEKRKLGIV